MKVGLTRMKLHIFSRLNLFVAMVLLAALAVSSFRSSPVEAASFSDTSFQRIWQGADAPVANGQASRSWLWGPEPAWAGYESYAEAQPNGGRMVQYFDKSRMEINNPNQDRNSQWFVTNGLLTVELVTGKMQVGDNRFENRSAAAIPVAGDPKGNPGPTYAAMTALTSPGGDRAPGRVGQAVRETVNGGGQAGYFGAGSPYGANPPVNLTYSYYEPSTSHNVANVMWNWMQNIPGSNWLFALGYPISEPYWSEFSVGGQRKMVLVQLFQRRALTYTPSNPAAFQVEMGNIGQHYFAWRYNGQAPPSIDPTNLDGEEQATLDKINELRRSNGLGTLSVEVRLENTSRWMSQDLGNKNYFSHTDSLGRDTFKRMADFGLTDGYRGENLAAGRSGAGEVFEQWKTSKQHLENLLNPNFKRAGLARFYNPSSYYKWYWSLEFSS